MATKVSSEMVTFDQGSVGDVLDKAKTLSDYTQLRSYNGRATHIRITDPGIAGFFYYDTSDTASVDNDGTVIVSGSKRWKRVFDGPVNVMWFGAKGDGVTNDTVAIQVAITKNAGYTLSFPQGNYLLSAASMAAIATYNSLHVPSNTVLQFQGNAKLILETGLEYGQVIVCEVGAVNVTLENIVIEGNNAFANGIVTNGYGGGVNENCKAVNCRVNNIRSELIIRPIPLGGIYQKQGGAAFIMETEGSGFLLGCSAYGCQFAIRGAPNSAYDTSFVVDVFYAQDCEAVLNTTPSSFANKDYAQNASYATSTRPALAISNLTFRNCGASTNERTQLSFIWRDTSTELGGRSTGSYYPWAGIRKNAAGTYEGLNWEPVAFNAEDTEYSETTTYSEGDRVKVTNDYTLGGVFCFGRSGPVTMTNIIGWNQHMSSLYPIIGAVFRGVMRGVTISNVYVDVACKSIFHFGSTPSSTWDLQPFMTSRYVNTSNVVNVGPTLHVAKSDMPWNGTWTTYFDGSTVAVNYQKNIESCNIEVVVRGFTTSPLHTSLSTDAPAQVITQDATNRFTIKTFSGAIRSGHPSNFATDLLSVSAANKYEVVGGYWLENANNVPTSHVFASGKEERHELQQESSRFVWSAKDAGGVARELKFDPVNANLGLNLSNAYDLGTSAIRWRYAYVDRVRLGSGLISVMSGSGSPESAVIAPVGALYLRTDGGAGTTLYIKEAGESNTGWVAK